MAPNKGVLSDSLYSSQTPSVVGMKSMNNFLGICLKGLLLFIRIAFYPIRILCNAIYGYHRPYIVGYAWYSKEEYQKLIDDSDDRLDGIVPTYDLWKKKADKAIYQYQNRGWIVIKVAVEIEELKAWLHNNELLNIGENRQRYVNHRMREFLENAII
ncbi:hypothetical protein [Desulfatitalea alkaliphila]|uniref:Uncharacterized protein n=1 Tax=Desulfatitalea alkaliphila TaxID=2929485 RepID=A0AA41R5V2_9BACT|nr:hypothetical protein [Desulfatitalea alkaliphila]MCJ8501650.1 hypothetical protein [Desulfatitalea alkaliphila]